MDLASCTVTFEPISAVPADGTTAATFRAVLRDGRRRPIGGRRVQFTATGSGNRFVQPEPLTNEEGEVTARFSSTRAERKTVLVVLDPGERSVLLPQALTIDFVEPTEVDHE